MKDRVFKTAPTVGLIVAAALISDYLINVLVMDNPQAFTPFTTLIIATLVATPLAY